MSELVKINLSEQQAAFVAAICEHGLDPKEAARLAGYSEAAEAARRLLRAPAILHALELGLRRKLHGELVPLAFGVLDKLLRDADSDRVRLDAARVVLDRAGFVPAKQAAPAGEREPEAMNTRELHALIERLERELGNRATPVNVPSVAQPIDNVETIEPE
jgi:phage terminase small subunit